MVEVVRRVARHSEPLHHPPRGLVEQRGERDDLVEVELFEAVRERRPPRLGCVAVPPIRACEPPPDLHRRREMRLEARAREPDEADEAGAAGDLDCPQSPALLLDLPPAQLGHSVTLRTPK